MYQSPETNLWILVIEFSALLVESKEKFFCKAEELHFYALRKVLHSVKNFPVFLLTGEKSLCCSTILRKNA